MSKAQERQNTLTERICAVVGHQPANLPFGSNETDERCVRLKEKLSAAIEELITENSEIHFLCPMNIGAELFAAEIVEALQAENKNVTLTAILPYELQAADWPEDGRERFFETVRRCNEEKHVQTHFDDMCASNTARFLVDAADCMIAVWNGAPGDVGLAVQMAKEKGIPVTVIHPDRL